MNARLNPQARTALVSILGMGIAMIVLSSLAFAGGSRVAADGNGGNPRVLPPGSNPYGHTYGEWGAAWWQWALSIPGPQNPLNDQTGANAGSSQSGPVWYLAGTLCPDIEEGCGFATATRTITVPSGKALFFPIVNTECSVFEGNGTTEAELRACTAGQMASVTRLECDVDGTTLNNLDAYRGPSFLFTWGPLPNDNLLMLFGLDAPPGTTSAAVSDGIYLMFAPLPVGSHTIHFTGWFGDAFGLEVTYHLTVAHDGVSASVGAADPAAGGKVSAASDNSNPNAVSTSWGRMKSTYR